MKTLPTKLKSLWSQDLKITFELASIKIKVLSGYNIFNE